MLGVSSANVHLISDTLSRNETIEQRIGRLGIVSDTSLTNRGILEQASDKNVASKQRFDGQHPHLESIGRSGPNRTISIPQTVPRTITGGTAVDVAANGLFANTMLFLKSEDEPVRKAETGIPFSPLIIEQEETTKQLQVSRQKLELLKSMDNSSFDSSLHYLANVRKFDENIRMLSEKKEMLDQKALRASSIIVLNLDPMEFAIQLTLIEFNYLKKIRRKELELFVSNQDPKVNICAPNVIGLMDFARHIYAWIQTEILTTSDLKIRGTLLAHFIRIAKSCHVKKNFDMFSVILKALQSPLIKRLSQTWKELSKPILGVFGELEQFTSSESYNQGIKMLIQHTDVPLMPPFESLLDELRRSDTMGMESNEFNASYRCGFEEILDCIDYLQNHLSEYPHKPDLMMQHYILTRNVASSDHLSKLSFSREAQNPKDQPWQTIQVETFSRENQPIGRPHNEWPTMISSTNALSKIGSVSHLDSRFESIASPASSLL